jgi:hypothetical protein
MQRQSASVEFASMFELTFAAVPEA